MRYIASFITIGLMALTALSAQPNHIETIVSLKNENGNIASVRFGLDSTATYGLDPSLNEFAVPGFPPSPMQLQALLTFSDNGQGYAAYSDFRPFKDTPVFSDTFHLIMTPSTDNSRGNTIVFYWTYPLDSDIDSIVISDLLGGTIKRVVLDSRRADTISGAAWNLESYRIIAYYNLNGAAGAVNYSGNDESTPANGILVPSGGWIQRANLMLGENAVITSYRLYSTLGQVAGEGQTDGPIDCSQLTAGMYDLCLVDAKGRIIHRRILR